MLEQQMSRLADAVEQNNTYLAALLKANPIPSELTATTLPSNDEEHDAAEPEDTQEADAEAPEVNWYHDTAAQKVWSEEGPAKRRKGILKVDEATAQRLIEKYAEEASQDAQADAAAVQDDDDDALDMDLGDDDEPKAKYDESETMAAETFGDEWNAWTKAAIAQALKNGAADKEDAQNEVKKFIVPLVRSFVPRDEKPKVSSIKPELRAPFLNKAQDFFN